MNRMRLARRRADKTQLQLMAETGIYYSTISKLERGWLLPTPEQKRKLATALKVKTSWLFPEES